MDVVFAREYETGIAGIAGILTYAANGCELDASPADLLSAVQFAQDQEEHLDEDDWLNDDTGRIHRITISDCESYLNEFK